MSTTYGLNCQSILQGNQNADILAQRNQYQIKFFPTNLFSLSSHQLFHNNQSLTSPTSHNLYNFYYIHKHKLTSNVTTKSLNGYRTLSSTPRLVSPFTLHTLTTTSTGQLTMSLIQKNAYTHI